MRCKCLLVGFMYFVFDLLVIGGHKGWGKGGEQDGCPAAIDKNDPNYVDEDD